MISLYCHCALDSDRGVQLLGDLRSALCEGNGTLEPMLGLSVQSLRARVFAGCAGISVEIHMGGIYHTTDPDYQREDVCHPSLVCIVV
jgi:hypothetical protein